MSTEIIGRPLNEMAVLCAEDQHDRCDSTLSCEHAVVEWTGSGHHFDARRELLDATSAWPDHTWTTTALLRFIHDVADERSEVSGLKRGPWSR